MKRNTAKMLIAGLCLLALFSCSPVEYPEALQRTPVVDKPTIYVTPHAKTAEVSFTPVRNADSYSVTIHDVESATTETQSVPMKVKDGLWTFKLNKLTPDNPYILTIKAENDKGFKEGSVSFKTKEDTGELEYAPIAYMSERDETTTTIKIEKRGDIIYRVAFNRDGVWELVDEDASKTGSFNITDLDSTKSYKARIDHKKPKDKNFSTYYTELTIPKDRPAFEPSVEIKLVGNTIQVDNTLEKSYMTLLFYPDGSGIPEVIETKAVDKTEGAVNAFDISNIGAFKSGLFDVVLTNGKTDSHTKFSKPDYITTPVIPKIVEEESNQKSVTLTWTQPDGIDDIIYTISGESEMHNGTVSKITPSEVEITGNQATLKLDDLVSNTKYFLKIEAELPNGENSTSTCEFTTDSFAGIYRWVSPSPDGKVSSFVIEVWDKDIATEKIEAKKWDGKWNDDFPYHVFVHESDPSYNENMKGVPIMPLFESKDEIPEGTISYASGNNHYQIGYRWNEAKWNTTTQKPSKWMPTQNIIEGDKITSYCDSWPFIGKVSTKTEFSFQVTDGKPQLRFRNAGDGPKAGFVNIGLFSNPSPAPGTDKFTFVLDRIGSVE